MPSERSQSKLLDNMIGWGDRLGRFLRGVTKEDFASDELRQAGTSKCIEAIGEAGGELLRRFPDFAVRHPELQLAEAYRARNRLSHGYDTIDWELLWDTATIYVPRLLDQLRRIRHDGDA